MSAAADLALALYREGITDCSAVADGLIGEGWRPPARVITGDVDTVTAELDALPLGTVIRIVEDEDGPQVFEAVAAHGHNAPPIMWSPTRSPRPVDSGYIARGETAVTILWAGETA
ncbi:MULTISPECIES: hypothetical protein [unclassified Rhodococcus (in: high G+C Gram-positive bacteria)]|uniref:hypothetical protein n=1 Tax=unclassified Rhodococcus (in: high G+C Gram-positive bacteria) TaxID=192944 RepID=UPI0006F30E09|nr:MULTISPECIES: hypothetical protein [unclassified Rhodococcus (in: high G+C Gram-positive bacteria)]KQU30318.1 hypothetical protein ASG69_04475 [Rhodococcus sp. Leaf225]KQU44777.1 hypothetical protein ASH03_12665 [Rhodococcus sp. Leaf258]